MEEIKVDVEIAAVEDLKLKTSCCCCAQSFYVKWPDCCGTQYKAVCLCCAEEVSAKCLQFRDDTKTCQRFIGQGVCIDLVTDSFICLDVAKKGVCCFCLTGAVHCNCTITELPKLCCKSAGNCFCCDIRCALPCDEEVPFEIGICGKLLWKKEG